MKKLSVFLWVLAALLSDVMCAVVAYNYCDLLWGGKYAGYSAPASTAFIYAVPFAIGIIVCIALAIICRKRLPKGKEQNFPGSSGGIIMKRSFMILLCFSLLSAFSGCKPNPSPVVDAGKTVAQEQPAVTQESAPANVPVSDVGSNQFEGELIEVKPQCPPSYGVTFRLPADWTCEVIQSDDEPTSDLVVSIKPKQANSEGAISISHMTGFGVCGTGLVQKEMEFNGHPARQGFYDGNALWSFIALEDPKDCVIMNSAENWYEEYEEEINQILSTVEFVYYEDHASVSEPTEPIIDSASFDIDSDGIIEDCTITYGPTSGLFTAVITASVNGDIKYKNTFNLAWGALSFGENSGFPYIVRVRALEGQESKTEYLSLSVQDGRIVIGGLDTESEGYWGDAEWNHDQREQSTVHDDTLYSYWKTARVKVYRSVDELAEVSAPIVAFYDPDGNLIEVGAPV